MASQVELVLVLYHSSCYDGNACAYLFKQYIEHTLSAHDGLHQSYALIEKGPIELQMNPHSNFIKYVAIPAGRAVESDVMSLINKTTRVFILDVVPANLVGIKNQARSIFVIDHHTTSEQTLKTQLLPTEYLFDVNASASYLVAKHFYPNQAPSRLIERIQNRDLWRCREDAEQQAFEAWFESVLSEKNLARGAGVQPFEVYAELDNDSVIEKGIEYGTFMIKYRNSLLTSIKATTRTVFQMINGEMYFITYANSSVLRSDLGGMLNTNLNDFAVVYCFDERNMTWFSVRSDKGKTNVGELMKALGGGGGHPTSAGFEIKNDIGVNGWTHRLPGTIYDDTGAVYDTLAKCWEKSSSFIDFDEFRKIPNITNETLEKLSKYLRSKPQFSSSIIVNTLAL